MGLTWSVLQPTLLLLVYTFVFGFVLQIRLPGATTSLDYVVWLFAGLVPWLALQESIIQGSNSLVTHSQIVKNLPIRLEMIPIATSLVGVYLLLVGQAMTLILLLFSGISMTWWILLLIPLNFLLLALGAAISLLLAPAAAVYRDLIHLLPTILIVILFLTPIIYPADLLPGALQALADFNPLYALIDSMRQVVYEGTAPSPRSLLIASASVGLFALVGLRSFRRVSGSVSAYV